MLQQLNPNATGEIESERRRTVFREKCLTKPKLGIEYGFAGITMPSRAPHPTSKINIAGGIVRPYDRLTYHGDENGLHLFKLPGEHPGHKFFYGCSGAPIIDAKGYIVAFVSGTTEQGLIRGFPASVAKSILAGCVLADKSEAQSKKL